MLSLYVCNSNTLLWQIYGPSQASHWKSRPRFPGVLSKLGVTLAVIPGQECWACHECLTLYIAPKCFQPVSLP